MKYAHPAFPGITWLAHRFFFGIARKNEWGFPVGYWRWGKWPCRIMRWWPDAIRYLIPLLNPPLAEPDIGLLLREGEGIL